MPDLFNYLPFDLISSILSYLHQVDCLEAMCVSHQWYEKMPNHATPLWTKIDFSNPWTKKNSRLLQCLGPHVHIVALSYKQWDRVFRSFQQYNVVPEALYIHRGQMDKYDEFDNDEFLQRLNKTTTVQQQCLKELTITNHPCDISLLDIARACPQHLTHLTLFLGSLDMLIFYDPIIEKQMEEMNEDGYQRCLLPHLLYLHLDTCFRFNTRIEPLLRNCPQLRVFQCSRTKDLSDADEDELEDILYSSVLSVNHFNLARIQQLCPKINSIDCGFVGLCEWTSIPDIDNDDGLQNLRITYDLSGKQTNTVITALIQAQETLEDLRIHQVPFDQSFVEARTVDRLLVSDNASEDWTGLELQQLPQLHRLFATMLTNNLSMNMTRFLCHQSTTTLLEQVSLEMNPQFFTKELVNAFISMTHLKRVSLSLNWTTEDLYEFERGMTFSTMTLPINFHQFASLSSLYEISLRYVILTDEMMDSLAMSPSLEILTLCGPDEGDPDDEIYPPCTITTHALIRFASSVRYRLKKLSLTNISVLDEDVLEAFGMIESLDTLSMKYCSDVTNLGLLQFRERIGKCLSRFECVGCHPDLSEVSIQQVQEKIKKMHSL